MAQARRGYQASGQVGLQLQLLAQGDPEIGAYVASLKKKYHRYVMPLDEARRIIDVAMGEKTLTDLLYEAGAQAG